MLRSCDAVPVIFKMYNSNDEVIFEERRVIKLSTLMATQFAYMLTRPDACVRLIVDVTFIK